MRPGGFSAVFDFLSLIAFRCLLVNILGFGDIFRPFCTYWHTAHILCVL
jgi:hypothetical protein